MKTKTLLFLGREIKGTANPFILSMGDIVAGFDVVAHIVAMSGKESAHVHDQVDFLHVVGNGLPG